MIRIETRHARRLNERIRIKKKRLEKQNNQNEFLGLHKLFDNSCSPHFKFLWLIIIVACLCSCFVQIAIRINIYLEDSITVDIELRPQTTFQFPSITLCSPDVLFKARQMIIQDKNTAINVTKLWIDNSIRIEHIYVTTAQTGTDNASIKPISDMMKIASVSTLYGNCLILTTKQEMVFRGPLTYVNLFWKHNDYFYDSSLQFFLHNDTLQHKYDSFLTFERAPMNCLTTFRIRAREFVYLNTSRNSCVSVDEYINCINKCIEKELLKVLTCRSFYIESSTLKHCTNGEDFFYNVLKMVSISHKMSYYINSCQCKRKCAETSYTLYKDDESFLDDLGKVALKLFYADETHETIRERAVYTTAELVSDIAGTVGLYLGISVFTMADFIEYLMTQFISKM